MHQAAVSGTYGAGIVYPSLPSLAGATRPKTFGALVDALSRRLLFQTMGTADRNAIVAFTKHAATDAVPSYYWDFRIKLLVTLVLDSPYFALR
jgi:hypothetical protein